MRTASRVFYGIAIFAIIATVLLFAGSGFENYQGASILFAFTFACVYLGYLLARQAATDLNGLVVPDAHHHEVGAGVHLPPPSWMPAAYSVAGGAIVLGLVFHYAVLWSGVALLVLTTIGWARESYVEYRREVAHAEHPTPVDPRAVELAHRLTGFRTAHGGADAVVHHYGRGRGEIVLVGRDGTWGTMEARDVAVGRTACALAGIDVHASWPAALTPRIAPDRSLWVRMGSSNPFETVSERVPRDGSTQVAAKVFLWIGVFGLIAATLFWVGQRDRGSLQGTAILATWAVANFYLYVGLKNAKARPEDAKFVDDAYVTVEPQQPPHMDPATLHLPGPSWMPALYSVAGALIVLGLVFHYAVLLAGVVALVLTTVGWAVESVHEYKAQLAHAAHPSAPDALHH